MKVLFFASLQSSISKMLHSPNLFYSVPSVSQYPPMINFLEGRALSEQPLTATTMTAEARTTIVTT